MSIWDSYYKHQAGLHRRTGQNIYGDIIYTPPLDSKPVQIACRIEYNFKEILDKDGNKITSEAMLFTNTKCSPLDVVIADGKQYTVKSCKPIDDIAGSLDHYEVYL